MSGKPGRGFFSAESRRALLDELFAVGERIDATPAGVESDPTDRARYAELRRTYREELPTPALSRCPFTGELFHHSLDALGLDGPWWDHRAPNRPMELLKGTVLSFTGAVAVREPLEAMPFLCRPGPGVPFVVPRLLAAEGVRAVLSSVSIGRHTGYVTVYFADPVPGDVEPVDDWGMSYYQFEPEPGGMGWSRNPLTLEDYDFDLRPHLDSGRLLWVAPGDEAFSLRSGASGCPYLDLEGTRLPQLIQDGDRWYEDVPVTATPPSPGAVVPPPAGPAPPPPRPSAPIVPVVPAREAGHREPEAPAAPAPAPSAPAPPTPPEPPAPVEDRPSPSPLTRRCGACGAEMGALARFCPSCGSAAAAPGVGFCAHCGQPRRAGAKFCGSCGRP